MKMAIKVACAGAVAAAMSWTPLAVGDYAYVSGTGGEPWGMNGNVNAMNDVFGVGNWTRYDFPTAVGAGLWDNSFILMDGGDGATDEFDAFVNANRADMEAWVAAGGRLIIGRASWGGQNGLDLGFGVNIYNDMASDLGHAFDTSHPVYDGPYGFTGADFDGDYLAHDHLTGDFTPLMYGDGGTDHVLLAEKAYGAGHAIFHGLTLPFFGEHDLWSPNCDEFHRNLLYYGYTVPGPGSLALLALAGVARRRRR
ncbi:MAG: hypothetical protein JSV91_10390 [Phycisphaerales bacterium]|nr:MAG: hypothetical protein JSV91_10390 [Phycisphaerales bacterium]